MCFIQICFFFFNDTATTEIYTLSLHDALPISGRRPRRPPDVLRPRDRHRYLLTPPAPVAAPGTGPGRSSRLVRSEEHTSELQSRQYLVCRLLLEKKNKRLSSKTAFDTANSLAH